LKTCKQKNLTSSAVIESTATTAEHVVYGTRSQTNSQPPPSLTSEEYDDGATNESGAIESILLNEKRSRMDEVELFIVKSDPNDLLELVINNDGDVIVKCGLCTGQGYLLYGSQ
jgi:hypothetical protein